MILSVGEILVDRLSTGKGTVDHVGGAPFNVAVAASRAGAEVRFVGKVGKDADGAFVVEQASRFGLDLRIALDPCHATTVALVTLDEGGERSFRFLREDAADYRLDVADLDLDGVEVLHLGTLMLNTPEGQAFFERAVQMARKKGVRTTVDANFRDDLFADTATRNAAMLPYLLACDVLKLGEDELYSLSGTTDVALGAKRLGYKGLLLVTMGAKGSVAYQNGTAIFCPSAPIDNVVDTTGAGDAFFGTVIALLQQNPTPPMDRILAQANRAGALATQREGAV